MHTQRCKQWHLVNTLLGSKVDVPAACCHGLRCTFSHQAIRSDALHNGVQHLKQSAASGVLDFNRFAADSNIEHSAYCLHEAVPVHNEVLRSGDGEQGSDDCQLDCF